MGGPTQLPQDLTQRLLLLLLLESQSISAHATHNNPTPSSDLRRVIGRPFDSGGRKGGGPYDSRGAPGPPGASWDILGRGGGLERRPLMRGPPVGP